MKKLGMTLLILLFLVLAGCGTTDYCKNGGNWNKDYWECKVYAERRSMAVASMLSDGRGTGAGIGFIQGMEFNKAIRECLNAKGWSVCR